MYTTHYWSVEKTPTNNVYRYEYSKCGVICTKCKKRRANYKMIILDHGDRYSPNAWFIDQKF